MSEVGLHKGWAYTLVSEVGLDKGWAYTLGSEVGLDIGWANTLVSEVGCKCKYHLKYGQHGPIYFWCVTAVHYFFISIHNF